MHVDHGRDPFNQNFRKFRSKTVWIGSVLPAKIRKKRSTFRGGPLFSVGPVRSKWIVPFDHSDPFLIPGPRCSVSSMYKMEENVLITVLLWIVNSGSIGVTRTSMYTYDRSVVASQAKYVLAFDGSKRRFTSRKKLQCSFRHSIPRLRAFERGV